MDLKTVAGGLLDVVDLLCAEGFDVLGEADVEEALDFGGDLSVEECFDLADELCLEKAFDLVDQFRFCLLCSDLGSFS